MVVGHLKYEKGVLPPKDPRNIPDYITLGWAHYEVSHVTRSTTKAEKSKRRMQNRSKRQNRRSK